MTDAVDGGDVTAAEVHVSDGVVARIAARHAADVPGVTRLQPTRTRAVASAVGHRLAGSRLSVSRETLTSDGVDVTATGPLAADVEIDVAVAWGRSCIEVATAVQKLVAERLRTLAGVDVTVAVNIVDVEWPDGTTEETR